MIEITLLTLAMIGVAILFIVAPALWSDSRIAPQPPRRPRHRPHPVPVPRRQRAVNR